MFPLQEVRKNKVLDLRDIRNLWVRVFCKFPNVVHKQVTATLYQQEPKFQFLIFKTGGAGGVRNIPRLASTPLSSIYNL